MAASGIVDPSRTFGASDQKSPRVPFRRRSSFRGLRFFSGDTEDGREHKRWKQPP